VFVFSLAVRGLKCPFHLSAILLLLFTSNLGGKYMVFFFYSKKYIRKFAISGINNISQSKYGERQRDKSPHVICYFFTPGTAANIVIIVVL
jgi:hypothetical protein